MNRATSVQTLVRTPEILSHPAHSTPVTKKHGVGKRRQTSPGEAPAVKGGAS